jgi:hypothetical protein
MRKLYLFACFPILLLYISFGLTSCGPSAEERAAAGDISEYYNEKARLDAIEEEGNSTNNRYRNGDVVYMGPKGEIVAQVIWSNSKQMTVMYVDHGGVAHIMENVQYFQVTTEKPN